MVSSVVFSSLITFYFIFAYSLRKYSNFILLHVAVQFSPLTEKTVISLLYVLASFVID